MSPLAAVSAVWPETVTLPPALWSPRNVTSAALTVVLLLVRCFSAPLSSRAAERNILSRVKVACVYAHPRFHRDQTDPVSVHAAQRAGVYCDLRGCTFTFNALTLLSAATRFRPCNDT